MYLPKEIRYPSGIPNRIVLENLIHRLVKTWKQSRASIFKHFDSKFLKKQSKKKCTLICRGFSEKPLELAMPVQPRSFLGKAFWEQDSSLQNVSFGITRFACANTTCLRVFRRAYHAHSVDTDRTVAAGWRFQWQSRWPSRWQSAPFSVCSPDRKSISPACDSRQPLKKLI